MPKSWAQKMETPREPRVQVLEKPFAGHPAGAKMLMPTPRLIAERIQSLPKGTTDLSEIRQQLAKEHEADFTCPLMTGMFARIVSERALEELREGKKAVIPFWRVVKPGSPLAKKLGRAELIDELRRTDR